VSDSNTHEIKAARPRLLLATAWLAAVAGIATTLAAQQSDPGRIKVNVSLALVEATVKDSSGQIMKDLQKEDFVLAVDGVPEKIEHFSRDQLPLAVALVVDLSGSIKPFLKPLRYATLTALKTLKPEDEVTLFTFTSEVDHRVELTKDKREISDQMDSLSAGGGTNINRAIYEAARYLEREAPAARRVIVLVSDNVPTTPDSADAKQVTDAALQADAAVYSLKVPGDNPVAARMMTAGRGLVNVNKLTQETGGEIFEVEKEGSLFLAFQALIERLKTRYTLGFYPSNPGSGRSYHKLDLRLQPKFGSKGRDYTVLSKNGYYSTASR
jgi:VWFA-related protein